MKIPVLIKTHYLDINSQDRSMTTSHKFNLRIQNMKKLIAFTLLILISLGQANEINFNRDIRPIFNRSCTGCHGGVKKAGGLSLITKAEAYGKTEHGVGIVPGKPEESMLYKLITHPDPAKRMPFEKEPLSKQQVALIKKWIEDGAQWDEHWAYNPVQKPKLALSSSVQPIDHFIRASLKNLQSNSSASHETLIRRAYLDLTGLPPSYEQSQSHLKNFNYEVMIDELLSSPKYGEKWASMWLDLARYSDTTGYEKDAYRDMFPYRTWLIKALNKNMPYDQFITEQIAGDLLPNPTQDQLIATAFHRQTQTNDEGGTDDEEFRMAAVMDRTNTTWEALMGTSFGCVQCHSHPYDPIPHENYYEFMAFFNNTQDSDKRDERPTLDLTPVKDQPRIAALRKLEQPLKQKLNKLRKQAKSDKSDTLKQSISALNKQLHPITKELRSLQGKKIPIMRELTQNRRKTHLFIGGNRENLGQEVKPGVPTIMNEWPTDAPKNRLGLSQWLTDPANPLVARVAVNRLWEQVYGWGLVRTLEDFGSQGDKPTHPELLDYLAHSFVHRHNWSMKSMLKEIMMSETYRQSSFASAQKQSLDPSNKYLARFPRIRLSSEVMRDQGLHASGLLSPKMFGPSVMPYQPDGIWSVVYSSQAWKTSAGEDQYRRGLYTYWRRTSPYPAMESFDMPSREVCSTRRIRTNTPLQALVTLNDPAYVEMATKLGERMKNHTGSLQAKINLGFELLLIRQGTNQEIAILQKTFEKTKARKGEKQAWITLGNILLNLDETINKI